MGSSKNFITAAKEGTNVINYFMNDNNHNETTEESQYIAPSHFSPPSLTIEKIISFGEQAICEEAIEDRFINFVSKVSSLQRKKENSESITKSREHNVYGISTIEPIKDIENGIYALIMII